ncbi:MAG TPA: hypothetical protein V6C76_12875 [Drouetiella sp.]
MRGHVLLIITLSCTSASFAQQLGAPMKRGVAISSSPNTKPNKLVKVSRSVDRAIAKATNALRADSKGIDLARIEERLKVLVGSHQVVCKLTLEPSGKVKDATIFESSGFVDEDQRAIDFLRSIKSYGRLDDSTENFCYRVDMPKFDVRGIQ